MLDKSKTSLDCLTKAQLVLACKKYKLITTGTKEVLRAGLKHYLKVHNIQFQVLIEFLKKFTVICLTAYIYRIDSHDLHELKIMIFIFFHCIL